MAQIWTSFLSETSFRTLQELITKFASWVYGIGKLIQMKWLNLIKLNQLWIANRSLQVERWDIFALSPPPPVQYIVFPVQSHFVGLASFLLYCVHNWASQ